MWIRLPGLLFGCFCSFIFIIYSLHNYNLFVAGLMIFLNAYNCIYFATVVVQNYGEHLEKVVKNKVTNEIKKVLVTEILKN